ncbi:MAG: anthranilate phosphoribosyltransferase [Betaproteobacteria bacterium TMED156]|nr:MAG: anthranilate phosphoribosyltransferase [Betaproteobacteria bacterium TMED156]
MNTSVLLSGTPDPTVSEALNKLVEKKHLSRSETRSIIKKIMLNELSVAQVAAVILALRVKGETVEEITGAVDVMRELVSGVDLGDKEIVDLCGTGGDGANTFNISTAAMFVVAASGIKVAKHGGRAVSSSTGSADLLEGLGVNINLKSDDVRDCIEKTGIGFMFAPNHHTAMKNVAPIRRDLGVRTIFNILGPLTNPARAKRQLMGVFDKKLLKPLAEVLRILGAEHVLLVHGENGLDEISLVGNTYFAELKKNQITEGLINPENMGLKNSYGVDFFESIKTQNIEDSKKLVLEALTDVPGNARDIVAVNAGAALYVGGVAPTLRDGIFKAFDTIKSGAARVSLEKFVHFTSSK